MSKVSCVSSGKALKVPLRMVWAELLQFLSITVAEKIDGILDSVEKIASKIFIPASNEENSHVYMDI